MNKIKALMLAFSMLVFVGCTANDQNLAESGDWYQIGYQDGVAGLIQRTNKALSTLGVVKQSDYDLGYIDGVKEYCNPNFAYQIGLSGQMYEGVCDGLDIGNKFRMEWKRGWEQYKSH